ncbi:hypothetical protein [Nakamurella sp.]
MRRYADLAGDPSTHRSTTEKGKGVIKATFLTLALPAGSQAL